MALFQIRRQQPTFALLDRKCEIRRTQDAAPRKHHNQIEVRADSPESRTATPTPTIPSRKMGRRPATCARHCPAQGLPRRAVEDVLSCPGRSKQNSSLRALSRCAARAAFLAHRRVRNRTRDTSDRNIPALRSRSCPAQSRAGFPAERKSCRLRERPPAERSIRASDLRVAPEIPVCLSPVSDRTTIPRQARPKQRATFPFCRAPRQLFHESTRRRRPG